MNRITSRFVLLIATAAVLPLVIYGAISVRSLRSGTSQSVRDGNQRMAERVANQIGQYLRDNIRVLQSVRAEISGTSLEGWQQERILKDYVLSFPEFREVTLFDAAGQPLATSAIGAPRVRLPVDAAVKERSTYIAPVRVDDDLLPTTTIVVRVPGSHPQAQWLVGEIALEQLWRMVDSIHLNARGFAFIVSEDGRLIAHGNPDKKRQVASEELARNSPQLRFVEDFRAARTGRASVKDEYADEGIAMLATAASVPETGWTVVIEEPTSEAYAVTRRLERQLLIAIALALLVTIFVGYAWSRGFIRRIFALKRVTRSIADGQLDTRVELSGRDEIRELGEAFNSMADRLVELQDDVRKQERQAMFGKIASGLVHDLSHPIQNIGNSCKLMLRMSDDPEYRETFRTTVDREMVIVKRVLEDLRNIARPIPLERFPLDLNKSVAEAADALRTHADTAGLTFRMELAPQPLFVEGDLFGLSRVHRNLIINAIQATAPGGLVVIATEASEAVARVRIYDTGCGIPADRLHAIFEDFVTTKRRGLGLGLAISRKIVEQLGGTISVTSEVGRGTTFTMEFPVTSARPVVVAAG